MGQFIRTVDEFKDMVVGITKETAPSVEPVEDPEKATCTFRFSHYSKRQKGHYHFSDYLFVEGRAYRLQLYTEGYGPAKNSHISVYIIPYSLDLLELNLPEQVNYTFELVHPSDPSQNIRKSGDREFWEYKKGKDQLWGYTKFFPIADLENSYLKNDTLIIKFEIYKNGLAAKVEQLTDQLQASSTQLACKNNENERLRSLIKILHPRKRDTVHVTSDDINLKPTSVKPLDLELDESSENLSTNYQTNTTATTSRTMQRQSSFEALTRQTNKLN